ncbi:MAG: hypothetical protein RL129_706, partial [Actinomycetota bacterium]
MGINENLLEITDLAKSYGPVVALKSANLKVRPGEIHAGNDAVDQLVQVQPHA